MRLESLTGTTAPIALDGGLATQLEAAGHDLSDDLWSARLLRDDPDAIEDVHLDYFRAGARVAITASYQASFEGFAAVGVDRDGAALLLRRSVELARRARQRRVAELGTDAPPLLVAASVGPYGAMLADGQEYTGDYGLSVAELQAFHRPRLAELVAAGPDLIAFETIPSALEAEALVGLLAEFPDVPAWLAYSCADGAHTCEGQPIEAAVAVAAASAQIVAVGVNCTRPQFVGELLERAATATDRPLVVYANDGRVWDGPNRVWVGLGSGFPAGAVTRWQAAGARLIGGCCGVGPVAIADLAAQLDG